MTNESDPDEKAVEFRAAVGPHDKTRDDCRPAKETR
jgi:hypothetical protein